MSDGEKIMPRGKAVCTCLLTLSLLAGLAVTAGAAEEPAQPPAVPAAGVIFRTFNTISGQPWLLAPGGEPFSKTMTASGNDPWDLRGFRSLSINATRERAGPSVVRLRWSLKSRVGGMYVSAAPMVVPVASSTVAAISLEADSAELVPAGHQRPWDALAAAEIIAIELRAECSFGLSGEKNVAIILTKAALEKSRPAPPITTAILDLAVLPPPPGYRAKAQLAFRIDPMPAEPYASSGDGDVRVILPGGEQVLAFLDQNYVSVNDGQAQRHVASGIPHWRAILPALPARGTLEIASGARHWQFKIETLASATPPRSTEITTGTPAAKAEPILSPTERWNVPLEVPPPDTSIACKGLPPGRVLTANGAWELPGTDPLAGTSMLWRPVPFWNGAWGEFGGAGRPNIILARKLDALLAQAAASGKSQPLVILDGEMFDRDGTFNWTSHPLNGVIAGPGELFRSERGSEFCRRAMRYCIARWGLSKAVSGLCLTPLLNAPGAPEFHASAAALLKSWTRELNLPVYSLHPFAQAPQIVKLVSAFEANERCNWRVDQRTGAGAGNLVAQDGSDGRGCYEVRAFDAKTREVSSFENYILQPVQWKKTAPDDFFSADTLLFDVWVGPNSPPDLRVGVHVRDRDGGWFEALLYGMPQPGDWRTFVVDLSGRNIHGLKARNHNRPWNDYSRQRLSEIGLHVYTTHSNWNPSGREVVPLQARFDQIRAVRFAAKEAPEPPKITLLGSETVGLGSPFPSAPEGNAPNAAVELSIGDLWQCHMTLNRTFHNPFDAAECDLAALITTPSGKKVRAPAFFNQACQRRELAPGGEEIVESSGNEFFTVRYRAIETGAHQVTLELREGGKYNTTAQSWQPDSRFSPEGVPQQAIGRRPWGRAAYANEGNGRRKIESIAFVPGPVSATLKLGDLAFVVKERAQPAKHPFRGFVRVAADKRHFQYDDGTMYYPLGPCLRSPSDSRIPYMDRKWNPQDIDRWSKRGTYQYDEYFEAFEQAGINWARVWMCSWWGALEWRRDWPGFQGVGRYNLLNAWRMDHLLETAEQRGVLIDLCLTNHGQFSLFIDTEWHNNPYSARLGGPLASASEFFTRAEAKIAHQNKLRYVLARYGHSPAIMAWSLFSELEWTEEYDSSFGGHHEIDGPAPNIESWHTEMATYLKALDPNQHLVGTHYSHPIRGDGTLSLPAMDFATSNAYSAFDEFKEMNQQFNAPYALAAFWSGIPDTVLRGFEHFQKPALVEEQGRHWGGGFHNPKEALEADLHCGLWGSLMQPLAGATGYWWWLHLHYDNRYSEYTSLAHFIEGEDFRPAKGESPLEPTYGRIEPENRSLAGRAMKSDRRMYLWVYQAGLPLGREPGDVPDGKVTIKTLKPGTYSVEFWNTRSGTRIEQREAVLGMENGQVIPMVIALPAFKGDIALKIKPIQK